MQKIRNLGKLFFIALAFGLLAGCGGSDDNNGGVGGNQSCELNPDQETCKQPPRSVQKQVPFVFLDVKADSTGFPEAPNHLFGQIWSLANIATYSVEYSDLSFDDKVTYQTEVEGKFTNILQGLQNLLKLGQGDVHHKIAYYRNNIIGDASVKFIDNGMGTYNVEKAVDLILPLPFFPIDEEVFTSDAIFPEFERSFLPTKVSTTLHYGYFGSPNFQAYKNALVNEGFVPSDGKLSSNVWVKEVVVGDEDGSYTLVYTFKHDNPLLDATKIPILSDLLLPVLGGTLGGFINHYINNWTNIDKYASWTINVKEDE
ncbi:MAG: hypothetical protein LBH45_04685 [Campylobacteraceae bacterium]|nr:hypothetical protein [Campylobacteraceae bacterium]